MILLLESSHSKTCSMLDTEWQGKFCKQERILWLPAGKLLKMQSHRPVFMAGNSQFLPLIVLFYSSSESTYRLNNFCKPQSTINGLKSGKVFKAKTLLWRCNFQAVRKEKGKCKAEISSDTFSWAKASSSGIYPELKAFLWDSLSQECRYKQTVARTKGGNTHLISKKLISLKCATK